MARHLIVLTVVSYSNGIIRNSLLLLKCFIIHVNSFLIYTGEYDDIDNIYWREVCD